MGELKCPVCGDGDPAPLFVSANDYPIVRCRQCLLAFTDDRNAPAPDQLYPAFDQSESVALDALRSPLALFTRQRENVVRRFKASGRLLDYGCGAGSFAAWMSRHDFESVGLEPYSLGEPVDGPNLRLVSGPLRDAQSSLGTFDVITMWHVLEHLPQPVELLNRLRGLLRPEGVLVVSVPNFSSWQGSLFRRDWFHLDPPRHLLHFESSTLADCLGRAGLSVVDQVRFLPEYGSSGWIQSSLNRVLPHRNFLYEVVKDRGALRQMGRLNQGLHMAGSLLLGAPLLVLSLPLEAAAAAAHRQAALTVCARARR